MIATLSTIGAAIATAASASDRDQPANPETFDWNVLNRPADQGTADERIRADRKPERQRRVFRANGHCRTEHNDCEQDSASALPKPERMIGYRLRSGEFWRACRGIEESPMAANRSFERALPGLVEGLDDVHVEILALA